MKFRCELMNGTVVFGDRCVECKYLMHIIKINKPDTNSELEDCTYEITVIDKSDILMLQRIDLSYDEYMSYLDLLEKVIKEEEKIEESICHCEDSEEPDDGVDDVPHSYFEFKEVDKVMFN